MQRSGLQTKIVANLQHKETTFIAAQNILEDAYDSFQTSDTQVLSDAMDAQRKSQFQTDIGTDPDDIDSPSVKIELGTPLHRQIVASSNLTYRSNGNDLGNPNTSGLRNDFSRGKNGMGIAKFEVDATARLPNGINSDQLLGFHMITPEQ